MTDAPEAISSSTPQAPAAAEPATIATASSHEGRTDAPDAAGPAGDGGGGEGDGSEGNGEAGAATGAPRSRRSRGGRGRRRSGQAASNAAGTADDTGEAGRGEGRDDGADADGVAATPVPSNPDARPHGGPRHRPDAPRQPRRPAQAQAQARPQGQQPPSKSQAPSQQSQQPRKVHPVLQRLFELYPSMFGARFLPLKLGVYQDLLERHGDEFKAEDLKIALGLHARSTRYLDAVAAGHQRHDLEARPVEPVAPEHVHHAILEVFRRRQSRTPDDLGPALRDRIIAAIEASGIGRDAYAERVRARDANGNVALDEALAELGRQGAKREALLRAFETTGKTEAEFADMYGMEPREVTRTLQRARKDKADAQAFAAKAAAAAEAAALAGPMTSDDTATDDTAIDDASGEFGEAGESGEAEGSGEPEVETETETETNTEAQPQAAEEAAPSAVPKPAA